MKENDQVYPGYVPIRALMSGILKINYWTSTGFTITLILPLPLKTGGTKRASCPEAFIRNVRGLRPV